MVSKHTYWKKSADWRPFDVFKNFQNKGGNERKHFLCFRLCRLFIQRIFYFIQYTYMYFFKVECLNSSVCFTVGCHPYIRALFIV